MSIPEAAVCGEEPLRSNFHSKKPHFFIIIHPALLKYDGSPEIPKRFMRDHGEDLSSVVFLTAPNGARWRVELTKHQGEAALLQEGWQQFSDFYAVGYGHFLLFRYEGDSHFHVFIFDMTATEIAYPSPPPPSTNHESENDVSLEILDGFSGTKQTDREEEEEGTVVVITSSTDDDDELDTSGNLSLENFQDSLQLSSRRTRKRKGPIHRQLETKADLASSSARKFRHECKETSGVGKGPSTAGARLRAESFESQNPFFIRTMRRSYVTGGIATMDIPMRFVRRQFQTDNDKATLMVSQGRRRWSVRYYLRRRDAKFSTDWGKFAGDNCLQVGDVCVFELIKPCANLLNVAIFRSEDR